MTKQKTPKKCSKPSKDSPKPLFISHVNRLSASSMKALALSEDELHKLSEWWAEYVKQAHLKQQDDRQKDCNFLVVAMEKDDGEKVFRWETYYHLTKQDEYFENSIESVMKVVYGGIDINGEEMQGLGINHWEEA